MINTFVNVWATNTLVLDLRWTEWAQSIILWNESDSDISLSFWWDVAVAWSWIILSSWEKIVYDTKDTQINVINAISTWASKKLTVFADVVTPWIISNFRLLNGIWWVMWVWENPQLAWEYSSNTNSYEISIDNGTTWSDIQNVNTYIPILSTDTAIIKVRPRKSTLIWTATSWISINVLPTISDTYLDSDPVNMSTAYIWLIWRAFDWDSNEIDLTWYTVDVVASAWTIANVVINVDWTYEFDWTTPAVASVSLTVIIENIAWNIFTFVNQYNLA